MESIFKEDLILAGEAFKEVEGRENFYDIAREIVSDHPVQACLIILAVWNKSRFHFVSGDGKKLDNFKDALMKCKPLFESLKNKDFQKDELNNIQEEIKQIYSILSKIKGIDYTGASKVMHLINPKLFVMWDSYIRGEKPKKHYQKLNIYHNKYSNDAEGYFQFLRDMQLKIKNIHWDDEGKTLAKAVDEYNYVNITLPIQEIENIVRKRKIN